VQRCVVEVLRRSVQDFPNLSGETVTRKSVEAVPRWTVGTTSRAQCETGPGSSPLTKIDPPVLMRSSGSA